MQLNRKAADQIKTNNKLIGRLMGAFNRGQKTIENWIDQNNVLLTTPLAVEIISEETGLVESQILESDKVTA